MCRWCRKEVHIGPCTQRVYFWTDPDGERHSRTVTYEYGPLSPNGLEERNDPFFWLSGRDSPGHVRDQRESNVMSEATREADLVSMSATYEALRDRAIVFLTGLLESLRAPVIMSANQTLQERDSERYAISIAADASIQPVWIETEIAGEFADIAHAMCESPKMIGDPDDDKPENHEPVAVNAVWLKAGVNPFAADNEVEEVISITVIGQGPRWIETGVPTGESVDFLAGEDVTITYERELDPNHLVYETIGFVPADLTAAVNFSSLGSFMHRLQSQVRAIRKSAPVELKRDFSQIEQDRDFARIARYRQSRR
jgi:hypothetical protein